MDKDIKVSVITPVYNGGKTIRNTIEAVLNQTYKNIEYIIVDGGSTDDTMKIVQEYEPLFKGRMKYVSEKDSGIYNAMNKGIRMSTGQLIGITNSDDFYELDAVEMAVSRLVPGEYQIIYGYMRRFGKHGEVTMIEKKTHNTLDMYNLNHPTCFVTRNIYCKYGLFLECFKIASDYELMLRCRDRGVSFAGIDHVMANFREGGASFNKRVTIEKAIVQLMHGAIGVRQFVETILFEYWYC